DQVVCYYGSWAGYRNSDGRFDISHIDPKLCTHLIYSFVGINKNGDIRVMDPYNDLPDDYGKNGFGKFVELRKKSPNAKMMVAIGGWSEGSDGFSTVVNNPSLRAKFVKNAVAFVKKYHFDGFDVDWEYPNQRGGKKEDLQNFVNVLKELKTELKKSNLLLSIAVGAPESLASQSYKPIKSVCDNVDFVNLMTYDLAGTWEQVTGHHAGLYAHKSGHKLNVDAAVQYWLNNGCSSKKLIVGVPLYGRAFTLADKNKHGLEAPSIGPATAGPYTQEGGYLGYNEICVLLKQGGWKVEHHKDQRTPYAYKNNQWIGYDDKTSIKEKVDYIKKKNLGGAMVWSIDTDDFLGKCGEKFPLLTALSKGLK
ncbi:Chitotriosidase-1, partial [Cyphomyrmex costatus]